MDKKIGIVLYIEGEIAEKSRISAFPFLALFAAELDGGWFGCLCVCASINQSIYQSVLTTGFATFTFTLECVLMKFVLAFVAGICTGSGGG